MSTILSPFASAHEKGGTGAAGAAIGPKISGPNASEEIPVPELLHAPWMLQVVGVGVWLQVEFKMKMKLYAHGTLLEPL